MGSAVALETGLVFLTTSLLLYMVQRALHRNLQIALNRLTGHPDAAVMLYWALLFPGVFLHELSHWLAALLLGVRRYRFAIWPQRAGGQIRLGAVQLAEADPFRMSLIGTAPLVVGLITIAIVGGQWPDASTFGVALWGSAWRMLQALPQQKWGWVGFYWIFAVGNAMWPSPADRAAWPAIGIAGGLLALFLLLAGPISLHQAIMTLAIESLARLTPLLAAVLFVNLPILIGLVGLNLLLSSIRPKSQGF
ncbi:hypothetical protein [Thermoflexus sp.]|uniref:hypothetical protein n=1 Tax=Thermoflexus sp. TaxID=1969742 RepID=UPI0026011EDD|nr:hypothetical protein [Thermoflexus sp.]MDW8179955.1 hypothetical protein [Anaerolineae bacterium]MCS6963569.1 hypothetical protein [Thermoflexus sp.]MCS7350504.1 hypothetical protein [Thermoflexus sp.]MCX7690323.1 hypothetical protein [Thermoflexus sp.]MDW8184451.1 hypothetical protein [Anaerolineae bacterium]